MHPDVACSPAPRPVAGPLRLSWAPLAIAAGLALAGPRLIDGLDFVLGLPDHLRRLGRGISGAHKAARRADYRAAEAAERVELLGARFDGLTDPEEGMPARVANVEQAVELLGSLIGLAARAQALGDSPDRQAIDDTIEALGHAYPDERAALTRLVGDLIRRAESRVESATPTAPRPAPAEACAAGTPIDVIDLLMAHGDPSRSALAAVVALRFGADHPAVGALVPHASPLWSDVLGKLAHLDGRDRGQNIGHARALIDELVALG